MTRPTAMISKVACVAAIVSMMLLSACGGAQSRMESHMQRGQAYFADGNYTKAGVEFRNALQIAPKDPQARVMAGRTAEKLGKPRDALGLYQSVVDDTPANTDARAGLGRLLIFGGAPDRGLAVIQPGLDKQPNNAVLLTLRAAARLRLKNEEGALADVDRALVLDPANEEAVALRAGLYSEAGDVAKAQTLVSNALQKVPNSVDLREVLARLYVTSHDPGKAEEQLRALIKLRPSTLSYREELAVLYSHEHRTDDAQHVLEAAVKEIPRNDTKLMLVDFVSSQRSPAAGEQVLRGFVHDDPDNYDLRISLGDLLLRSGSVQEATTTYNEVIRRNETGPQALVARDRLAAVAASQNHYDDAQKLLEQVLQKNPRDTDALALRGELNLLHGRAADAIVDLRAVVNDQPKNVRAQRMLAAAYAANGDPGLAQQSLTTAIQALPGEVSLRVELAKVLIQDNKADQATSLMEQAVHDAPQDPQAREGLVRAYIAKPDLIAARKAADDLTALRPDSATGPFLAGLAAQAQMQLGEAQKYYERALVLKPQFFEPLETLARLEMSQGRGAQAITLVKGAVERNPQDPLPLNLLGGLYLTQKDFPKAIETLTQTTVLAPNWSAAYRNLALAKFATKDVPGAVAAYQTAIKDAPDQPNLVIELAQKYEGMGRVDDAVTAYEEWHRRNPQVQIVSSNLAKLLVNYKTDRASLDQARDLTSAFATSADAGLLDTNGWVHFKRGEYADALPVLQRAAERVPEAPEVHYHLGMTELHVGQSDRARKDLQTAVASPAKFSWSDDARRALADLAPASG